MSKGKHLVFACKDPNIHAQEFHIWLLKNWGGGALHANLPCHKQCLGVSCMTVPFDGGGFYQWGTTKLYPFRATSAIHTPGD